MFFEVLRKTQSYSIWSDRFTDRKERIMRRIINNKMYNTETAKEISTHRMYPGEFREKEETLYRKKTGEFFLAGSGGPRSPYAVQCSYNTWTGGSGIIPLSEDGAKDWLMEHGAVEEYIEAFGEPEE